MNATYAVASLVLALLLSSCGSPGTATPSSATQSVPASESPSPTAEECSAWKPEASDGAILLYFPCDPDREMYPVERTVTATGNERLSEVVRLYLAGPSAEEREAGFSSLLSPGNVEIVEITPVRVVLDFPGEVNNVSTSAGSRAVLDGLRQTLIDLSDIKEIELRLGNDCAAGADGGCRSAAPSISGLWTTSEDRGVTENEDDDPTAFGHLRLIDLAIGRGRAPTLGVAGPTRRIRRVVIPPADGEVDPLECRSCRLGVHARDVGQLPNADLPVAFGWRLMAGRRSNVVHEGVAT